MPEPMFHNKGASISACPSFSLPMFWMETRFSRTRSTFFPRFSHHRRLPHICSSWCTLYLPM